MSENTQRLPAAIGPSNGNLSSVYIYHQTWSLHFMDLLHFSMTGAHLSKFILNVYLHHIFCINLLYFPVTGSQGNKAYVGDGTQ